MSKLVRIRSEVLDQMRHEATKASTKESCGLLAGRDGIITRAFPAANSLASATSYEIPPEELFGIMREIRAAGLQMLGIYHSHPSGDNSPSPSDISRAYYPAAAYFIISPLPNSPQPVRAFSIRDGHFTELKIQPI